ncbi:MAG: hypothetical protein ACWA42_03270 [Lutibacter sp.]
MNFSKKNHEHKIVNIKNVSKKIILGIVFVFATVSFVKANINEAVKNMQPVPAKCVEGAQQIYDDALCQGYSYEDAYTMSDAYYQTCVALNKLAEYLG